MSEITTLKLNQIFVFGSNKRGEHLGGAANQAYMSFGAVWGFGLGIFGQSYAFPTLGYKMEQLPISDLENQRDYLYDTCERNPNKEFLLTKVGCGIAGYSEDEIKPLFSNPPKNLTLPEDWRD